MALRRLASNLVMAARPIQQQMRNYRAAVLTEFGKALEVQELKSKQLGDHEVRVNVYNCGVNASDILTCQGVYENLPQLPFVPGFEFSGEVTEVGSQVTSVQKGGRVIGLQSTGSGGFAEEIVSHVADLFPVDNSLEFEAGASLADTYATALLGLQRRAALQRGDTVLVTAAAGGLGLAAVDLAANVFKCQVIAVCGTEDKASLVREKGAFAALGYHRDHLRHKVHEVAGERGIKVIFDAVGGEVFEEAIKCVAHEGKVIVAGFASRTVPHVATSALLPRSFALIGLSLRHYREADNAVFRQAVLDVIELHEAGLIAPHVSAQFPLDEVNQALSFISERKSTGKVLLDIR
ncbi:quinone oxidoreductase-like protein 2 isoform X2 [Pollicipes pollicipes]|nr:quinone oxidoreductase-like protein 2 isoform X2 [Pollicipes pollicipes]XP_037078938.1 quinone oxidoreductase-like protein 2 isoform X2 [Pollicipes pollicipes]XP_037078939.1 quinone oxidoreductase-like protein 2 isoform X2 [Pollicipes pollicipes]